MQVPAHRVWPAGHVPPQVLPSHVAVPPTGVGHGVQDVLQVATSALLAQIASQAWKPSVQVKPHWVPSQVAVPLSGTGHSVQDATPQELVAHWKANFPTFWPKGAKFYAPLSGISPGEVALLEVQAMPGGGS